MGSPALQSMELDVEQTTEAELVDVQLLVEGYGNPTSATMEENHPAALQVGCRPGDTWVDHPKRTWSSSLAPLLFLRGTNGILPPDGATHELVEGLALEDHRLLMDLGAQPLAEQGCLLRIHVDVLRTILGKVYEPLQHSYTVLKPCLRSRNSCCLWSMRS
jgi:hypothetical protein